jgi:hypothetical protein
MNSGWLYWVMVWVIGWARLSGFFSGLGWLLSRSGFWAGIYGSSAGLASGLVWLHVWSGFWAGLASCLGWAGILSDLVSVLASVLASGLIWPLGCSDFWSSHIPAQNPDRVIQISAQARF